MTNSINELKSYTEYNVNAPTSVFTIGFQYEYNVDHVNVYVDGVEATAAGYTVQYDSQGTVQLTPAVPSGVVLLQRETNVDGMVHTFSAGAKFTAGNMDEDFKQLRHAQQEVRDETARTVEQFTTLNTNATAALNAANTAVNTANSIDAKASTALANSNTAVSTANSANSTANTALSTANGIDAKATSALSNSSTALSTANTALSTANGIDAKATQAQQDASTALSTASALSTQKGAANGITPLDANTKVNPIYLPNATETTFGVAEVATQAETNAGTSDTTIVTPKKLKDISFGRTGGYVDVTASRLGDTLYSNPKNTPLVVAITAGAQASTASNKTSIISGNLEVLYASVSGGSMVSTQTIIVPPLAQYKLNNPLSIVKWMEW